MRSDWWGNHYHTARSKAVRTPHCDALGVDLSALETKK